MTDKQRQAIEKHGRDLLAIFPQSTDHDPVSLCRRLRRLEVKGDAAACAFCNGEIDQEVFDGIKADLLSRVSRILNSDRVWFNGDPRGYALKIDLQAGETLHRDWGGYGIIAPEIDKNGD